MRFFPRCLIFSLATLLLFAGCGAPKLTPEQVAIRFFEAIKQGNIQQAYDSTSFAFQAQQTLPLFDSKLRDLSLGQYQSIAWEPAEVAGNDARVRGIVKRSEDEEFAVRLALHRQRGRWLISALAAGVRDANGQPVVFTSFGGSYAYLAAAATRLPPVRELQALVAESLQAFDAALENDDFTDLYRRVSTAWQRQASSARFQQPFEKFITQAIRLQDATGATITFSEPPRLQNGSVLLLQGHAATHPRPVRFILRYLYETPKWRLIGMSLNVDDGAPTSVPSATSQPTSTPAAAL